MVYYDRAVFTLGFIVAVLSVSLAESASFQNSDHADLNDVLLDSADGQNSGMDDRVYYFLPVTDRKAGSFDEKRAFHAMRGKKDDDSWDTDSFIDDKRAFHAMRGKRLLPPSTVDSFIAQLRRAVLQGKRGSGFFGMRGKRAAEPEDQLLHEGKDSMKHSGLDHHESFFASRGKRAAEDSRQL